MGYYLRINNKASYNTSSSSNALVLDGTEAETIYSPPSSPVKGDLYFDGNLNQLRVYN